MRFLPRLRATLTVALLAALLHGCAHVPLAQPDSVFPQDLVDRVQLASLMNAFVVGHRSCSFQDLAGIPPGVQAPCLGPTTIWASSADPLNAGGVWVYVRQTKVPHNEYVVEARHHPNGWVIISIALIDA